MATKQILYDGVDVKWFAVEMEIAETSEAIDHGFSSAPIVTLSAGNEGFHDQKMNLGPITDTTVTLQKLAGNAATGVLVCTAIGAPRSG